MILEDTLEAVAEDGVTIGFRGHLLVQFTAEDLHEGRPMPEAFEQLNDAVKRFAPCLILGWEWAPVDGIPGRGRAVPAEIEWDAPVYHRHEESLR